MTDTFTNTPNCKECQWLNMGWCTRFPEHKFVDDSHYCGEFKAEGTTGTDKLDAYAEQFTKKHLEHVTEDLGDLKDALTHRRTE